MIRKLIGIISVSIIISAAAAVANAQTVREISIYVPFSFNVGNTELPAGDYEISYGGVTLSKNVIVRSEDGKNAAIAIVGGEQAPAEGARGQVKFVKTGGRFYLSSIVIDSTRLALSAPSKQGSQTGKNADE